MLEPPTWLSGDSLSVKIHGVNKKGTGEYAGECAGSQLPAPLQMTYGNIFRAQPAERMPPKSGLMAAKDCPWREELPFKEASR